MFAARRAQRSTPFPDTTLFRSMIQRLQRMRKREDRGFTLIELMVVVLIIGILVAIAVPTFLSAQNNAKKKAPESTRLNSSHSGNAYAMYSQENNGVTQTLPNDG